MPSKLTGLQVFIASPGGLKDERAGFKEVMDRVNRDHAHAVGLSFIPRGWEYASSGVGRPQEIINDQVRESDYLLVILWDQWGKPPADSGFTSGTEEEYSVGLDCLRDPNFPMRDIVVLFKGVNERQMADPGDDLKKVLAFKEQLEKSRLLLYSTFDSLDEFKDDFRTHLHQWIRDWQNGAPPARVEFDGTSAANLEINQVSVSTAEQDGLEGGVRDAKSAAERGRLTRAEQLYAQAIKGQYDREAYTEYVRFLRKYGRLTAAETTARRFLGLAQDNDDYVGEIEALANLAILARHQGSNDESLRSLEKALNATAEYLESLPDSAQQQRSEAIATKAFLLDNKSLTLRRIPGRVQEALAQLDEARACQKEVNDSRGEGFTLRNKGTLQLKIGLLDEAQSSLEDALKLFQDVGYENGQAAVLGALGELYEARGELAVAIECLNKALAASPQRVPSRNAGNYAILSRLHLKAGNLEDAGEYATQCSIFGKELGTPDSLATALRAQGAVSISTRNFHAARTSLDEAFELFETVDNPVGMVSVLLDLVRLRVSLGDLAEGSMLLERAGRILDANEHFVLRQDFAILQEQLGALYKQG